MLHLIGQEKLCDFTLLSVINDVLHKSDLLTKTVQLFNGVHSGGDFKNLRPHMIPVADGGHHILPESHLESTPSFL